ncbi:hypothetical protein SLA2020_139210 [Shorea laevis]
MRRFKPFQIFSSSPLQPGETFRCPDSASTNFFFEKVLENTPKRNMLIIPAHFMVVARMRAETMPHERGSGRKKAAAEEMKNELELEKMKLLAELLQVAKQALMGILFPPN